MNHKHFRLLCCLAGALAFVALLAFALGQEGISAHNTMSAVSFSRESGFYRDAFDLELYGGGDNIYYTLDCSDPDEHSLRYTGPIRVEDASRNENVYSMNRDVCIEFREELLVAAGTDMRYDYDLPKGLVDKATVVRAVAIDANGEKSAVSTGVYFVDYDDREGYRGMRVVSISLDPKHLFDFREGIYVTGEKLENALVDGAPPKTADKNYGVWPANYRMKGREWEREAYVCCFDENREILFSGSFGLRIQGGASRGMLPKSLNLFARKEYGQAGFSGDVLFGTPGRLDSINLNSGAQAAYDKLKDYLVNACVRDLRLTTREYVPCMVFLEGEFWGFYWMTPRYEEEFFQYRYNVAEDDLVVMKLDLVEVGAIDDRSEYYLPMMAYICDHDMRDPEMYDRACEMIDIQSCIDYYATEIYIANTDWPHHNVQMWRTKEVSSGSCADARWRWVIYDTNISMAPENADKDYIEWAINRSDLFASLMENEGFAQALRDKLVELAQNNFNPARMEAFIDGYALFMADAMEKEYARFYGDNRSVEDFFAECDDIKAFFAKRCDYIMKQYGGDEAK